MTAAPLERSIGPVSATAMVVGTIIGASIFVQSSVITAAVPSRAGVLVAWLCAGLLTLFGALVTAELASAFPRSGGMYVFIAEAFGPAPAFLWGWAMFWSMHSGIIAVISVVVARYAGSLVPLGPLGSDGTAVLSILALSAVNILGVRAGSRLQTGLTALKVAAVLGIVALLFAFGHPVPAAGGGTVTVRGFVLAVSAGVFAFGGWHMVAYAAEETVEPERTIPRALLAGVLLVTACYIGLNAAYFRVLPVPAVAASQSIAADAVREVAGAAGARIVAVIVVLSALGANNGIILAGPRVYYAMARDGVLFRWMGEVHPRFRTPHLAIALQALWASVLVLTGSYESLFSQVVYTEWIFFALMVCALFPLRRRSGYAPRYRVPGYPVLPLIFVAAALAMALSRILASSRASLPAIVLVLSGLPVYYFWARRPARGGPSMDRSDP